MRTPRRAGAGSVLGLVLAAVAVLSTAASTAAVPRSGTVADPDWGTPSAIRDYVEQERRHLRIEGLHVTVLRDGATTFSEGFGTSDGRHPVDEHTVFTLGSVSKQLTGLAVQRLVADGRLSLDAPVAGILPGFGDRFPDHERVTVRQLLGQTSGFDTSSGRAGWVPSRGDANLTAEVDRLAATPLAQPPGRGFLYSNSNYDLLGAIVERVTQEPFATAMRRLVFQPNGLSETAVGPVRGQPAGYLPWFGVLPLATPDSEPASVAPAALIRSTSRDLAALLTAELAATDDADPTLLLPSRVPLTRIDDDFSYGSGWYVRKLWEVTDRDADWRRPGLPVAYEHDGSTARSLSYVMFSPSLRVGVIALSNTGAGADPDRWGAFSYGLVHTVLGTQPRELEPESWLLRAYPVLLVGLPLLQLVSLAWVVRARRRRRRVRTALAAALVVHGVALFMVWWVAPRFDPDVPSIEFLWSYLPDLALVTIVVTILALTLLGIIAVMVAPRPATRAEATQE